jgi:hypothetical protein
MKQFLSICIIFSAALFVLNGCQKELSIENGAALSGAQGTLLDSLGNCKSAILRGTYIMDSTLTDSNYVYIQVNFTGTGKYFVGTDTLNGIWFCDSGYALVTGSKILKLKGYGTPILPISNNFLVKFNNEYCSFSCNCTAGSDYLPTTVGSTWTFQYLPGLTTSTGSLDSFNLTVVPQFIPYNGKNYYQYATSLLDTFYYAKLGDTYYEYGTVDFDYTSIFDGIGTFIEYPYLKDKQPVGTTWESGEETVQFGGFYGTTSTPGLAKTVFTISAINQTFTIAGKTLTGVTTVKREIYFKATGAAGFTKVLSGTASYAKGIGLIDQYIALSSTTAQTIPVIRWNIK